MLKTRSISYHREEIMFGLGMPEMLVILVIALLVFGPSKLPSLGKSVGDAIRGFKKGLEDDPPKDKENIERPH